MAHKIVPESKYPGMYRIVLPDGRAMMGGGMVHRDEYDAYLGDRLVCSSWTPFFDAARVLIAEGHDPEATLVMRHRGSDHDVVWAKLRYAATLTVSGNYFVPYRPPPPS